MCDVSLPEDKEDETLDKVGETVSSSLSIEL